MCGGSNEERRMDNEDAGHQFNFGSKYQFDPDFKGPKKGRSCTDILCLALFTVFLVTWAVISVFAYCSGSPERLLYPTDSLGKRCGVDPGVEDKPFLLFFDLTKCARPTVIATGCPTNQICVKECPTEDFSSFIYINTPSMWDTTTVQSQLICTYDYDKKRITSQKLLQDAVTKGDCAPWYLKSKSIDKIRISENHPEIRNPTYRPRPLKCKTTMKIPSTTIQLTTDCIVVLWIFIVVSHFNGLVAGRCLPGFLNVVDDLVEISGNLKSDIVAHEVEKSMKIVAALSSAEEVGEMVLQDLVRVWPYLLFGLIISMIVCLIFILIMRWLAGLMVWLSIIGVIVLLAFGVYLCYARYASMAPTEVSATPSPEDYDLVEFRSGKSQIDLTDIFKVNIKSYLAKRETWMVLLIITASLLAIILLILIFLRNRIRIAIELIREASRAVGSVTSSLFFPVFPWLVQLIALAWGLSVALYLASSGRAEHRVTTTGDGDCVGCDFKPGDVCILNEFECGSACTCQFFADRTDNYIPWLQAFNLFGTLWLLFFVSASGEMVLAGVFGSWYWTWNKAKGLPFFALTGSIWRTLRYHIGTLAFGSLLIAICRFIRIFLEYIHHKLKKRDNKFVQCVLCCLRCCFWCLEKFLRFLNRNAYVMCAIHGTNFCKSAKDAFNLLMRNVIRVVVLDKVTDFLLFLGKILIVTGMTVASYYVFGHESSFLENWVPQLNYYFLPIIIIAIGTYFISTIFFGVYAMAIDTLFLCFLEDSERNDGSAEKPYFMSKNLMKILGKKNQLRK